MLLIIILNYAMNTKNCVISAVGKNSLHKMWVGENSDFDLHLITYDDSLDMFRKDARNVCHIKGYKLKVIYKYLMVNMRLIDSYDYFFFPDDDIMMDATTINALFDAMRHYNLRIAQPALCMSYFTWSHTLKNRYCKLRYTNFVEMMVPCFSREALQKVLFTFNENETGWGTETHWPLLINATNHDMAIIDEVNVVHTRPIQPKGEFHNQELSTYLKKYNIETRVHLYDFVPYTQKSLYCCDEKTFDAIRDMLLHWIQSERISSMNIGEDGYFGYVHLLFLIADITQSQVYADAAFELLSRIQDKVGSVKDDMSFTHGITGCSWLIEYLVGEEIVEANPQELLSDVDAHIQLYLETNANGMTLAELAGIGKYFLAKYRNRPDYTNKINLQNTGKYIKKKFSLSKSLHDARVVLDAMEILKECGLNISKMACHFECLISLCSLSYVEKLYYLFRLYTITYDTFLILRIREEMKSLPPLLLELPNALMLAEMLYYSNTCVFNKVDRIKGNDTAILFVTHIYNKDIEHQINKLRTEVGDSYDVYVVFQADKVHMDSQNNARLHAFTLNELNRIGYKPWGCTIMDGNFHFVLLDFYRRHPNYDYYWLVEYDVRFNGSWQIFFSFFTDRDEDFLSAHIETQEDNPNWMRWHEIELMNIPLDKVLMLKSFNPICRFSNRAFSLLHNRCMLGDRGHNELLMPTLFNYFQLKIADFGGTGRYTYKEHPNLFYVYDKDDDAEDKCTHRCYPAHLELAMKYSNMIYHPIK